MKKVFYLFVIVAISITAAAQRKDITPMKSVNMVYRSVPNSNQFRIELKINLLQSDNIAEIHVKIGTSKGSDNLFSRTFIFDISGVLNDGTSYMRTGNTIILDLGTFEKLEKFSGEVVIERTNSSLSDPVFFGR